MRLSRYDYLRIGPEKNYLSVISWARRNNVPIHHKDIYIVRSNSSKAVSYTSFIDTDEITAAIAIARKLNNPRYHKHYDRTLRHMKEAIDAQRDELEHIFTFGSGQIYQNSFIAIYSDDFEEARKTMFDRFGEKWSMHYEPPHAREKAGVKQWNLKQIH